MIDIFWLRPATKELMHARVAVTTAPDAERAQALVETLTLAGIAAGGRPSRARGTVAQIISRRDAALDRELVKIAQREASHPMLPRLVASRRS